jgi:hypothetical protein
MSFAQRDADPEPEDRLTVPFRAAFAQRYGVPLKSSDKWIVERFAVYFDTPQPGSWEAAREYWTDYFFGCVLKEAYARQRNPHLMPREGW